MKILAHTSFIGTTGYANHARSFFCKLNQYHTVKVRNFPVPHGWKGMTDTPFDDEPYITSEMKDMLILQTLWTGEKSREDFPMYGYKGDFEPDVHIILIESNHHYFYDDYDGYKIGFCVYESTRFPKEFFERLHYFDEMWVPTQWQADSLIAQGYPKEKVSVVTEGVDVDTFKPIDKIPKKKKFRFLYFGRWDYRKSTTEVLKAFGETFKDYPNVELIASVENPYPYDGTKSTKERMKKYGVNYKNIKYVKFVEREEYVKYLQEGNVFLSCARSEGWNLPLIEAMSCGTPALYSNWGGQLQFAEGKGVPVNISHLRPANIYDTDVEGEYCEPDFDDLKEKMFDVYCNYDGYRNNALLDAEMIHNEFNWDKVARNASKILESNNELREYTPEFWNMYYSIKDIPMDSSSFARFCLPDMGSNDKLLDICCGNGRDSNFFNSNGMNTSAFDIYPIDLPGVDFKTLNLEDRLGNFSYEDKSFDSVYSRFVLHAVPETLEDYILISSNRVLKDDGLLFIEVRSDTGEVSEYADPHYRRLINIDILIEKLKNLNFEVKFKEEKDGLSIYKGDDPILIRIIARKKGEIETEDRDKRTKYLNPIVSKELLQRVKCILDSNNITFLLLFGTLLGAYRDKGFINPDTDIDLGLFKDDQEKIEKLVDDGYFTIYGIHNLKIWWTKAGDSFIKLQYKEDEVDFYFFQKINKGGYECDVVDAYYTIPNEQLDDGLSEIEFLGNTFKTVKNIEEYLTRAYGNWRTQRLNFHAPDEKNPQPEDDTEMYIPKEVKLNFVDGPRVEIFDEIQKEYIVEFIDLKSGLSIYENTNVKTNQWCGTNVKYHMDWLVTVDGVDNNFHFEHRYSPSGRRVLVGFESSLLDHTLAWIPQVENFRVNSGAKVICSTSHNDTLKDQYPHIEFVEPGAQVSDIYSLYRIGVFKNEEDQFDKNFHPTDPEKKPLGKVCSDILGIEYKTPIMNSNDDIFVIGQHVDSIDKEEMLIHLINQLKEFDIPIILGGHYPVNRKIQKMVDYYLFDKDNPSGGELSKKFWAETEEYRIEYTTPTYDYAVWTTMRNTFNFAKYLNKKNVHYIEYDCEMEISEYKNEFINPLKGFDVSIIRNYNKDSIDECETYIFSMKTDIGVKMFNGIKTKEEYVNSNSNDFILERVFYKLLHNTTNSIYNSKYYITNRYTGNLISDIGSSLICDEDGELYYNFDVHSPEETFTVSVDYDGIKEYVIEGGYNFKHQRKGGYHTSYKKFILKIGQYKQGGVVKAFSGGEEISRVILCKTFEEFKKLNNITFKTKYMEHKVQQQLCEGDKINLNINFIDGSFVEILNEKDTSYHVEFIDASTNNVEYRLDLKNNHWAGTSKKFFVDWLIKVRGVDDDYYFEHRLDLNERRVVIAFESKSLGDTLAWVPYVEKFRTEHKCRMVCSTFHNKLFKDQYPNIEFVEPGSTIDDIYALYRIGWFRDGDDVDYNQNKFDPKTEPLTKTASDILGLDYVELKPLLPVLSRKKKRAVSIAIHSTAQAKYWNNPTGWQDVVDHLNSHGYEVQLVSNEENGYMGNKHPKNITIPPSKSLEDVIKIIQESELFIGISSGLSWLAWAAGTETILISGFSEPYTEPLNGVRRIINKDVCHGCFNRHVLDAGDWNWCPEHKNTDRQFECSKEITSESVIEQINLALGL